MGMKQFRLYAVSCVSENGFAKSKLVPVVATEHPNEVCLKFSYGKDVEEAKENLIKQGYLKRLEDMENCKYYQDGKEKHISVDIAFTDKIIEFINWQ